MGPSFLITFRAIVPLLVLPLTSTRFRRITLIERIYEFVLVNLYSLSAYSVFAAPPRGGLCYSIPRFQGLEEGGARSSKAWKTAKGKSDADPGVEEFQKSDVISVARNTMAKGV